MQNGEDEWVGIKCFEWDQIQDGDRKDWRL